MASVKALNNSKFKAFTGGRLNFRMAMPVFSLRSTVTNLSCVGDEARHRKFVLNVELLSNILLNFRKKNIFSQVYAKH